MENLDTNKLYLVQTYRFQEAVSAFGNTIGEIHTAYKDNLYSDWPTVLLSTLLQTTARSLFQLLPKTDLEKSIEIVDRRSIASLIRNIVDTHDVLELLCDVKQSEKEFDLHRDIMGYYLSGRLHKFHGSRDASSVMSTNDCRIKACKFYPCIFRGELPLNSGFFIVYHSCPR